MPIRATRERLGFAKGLDPIRKLQFRLALLFRELILASGSRLIVAQVAG